MAEQTNFTPLSVPLARQAINLAPARPISDLLRNKRLNKTPSKFEAAVKRKYDEYMAYESAAWNEIISMCQLVALFRQGQQLLQRRPFGAPGWYVRPIANDDTYRQTALSFMGFYSQVCEAKICASNPNVLMRAGDDTPEAIAAAQACRPVVDYYENQWYTSKFARREAIRLLTDGMFIHRVRWNPFLGTAMIQERQVTQGEPRQMDDGYGECAECGAAGSAAEFSGVNCPQCDSLAIDVQPPTMKSIPRISMGPSRPVGEPEIISTPLAAWRWDLHKDLEGSSWAIYRQRITQGVISLMLSDVIVPDSSSGDDRGLDVIHALAYAGQAFQGASNKLLYGGFGQRDSDKRPTMAEFWMSPEDYADIDIEEGDTIGGVSLPAGKMGQLFKDPMCFVGLNDFAVTIGVYQKETQRDEVITGQWIMQSESGVGRGMEDLTAVQKRSNAVDGQIYQGLATTATPAVFTDKRLLKEDQSDYLFKPGQNIDINLSLLPPNMRLQDAIFLGSPGAVSQQYIQYGQQVLTHMADISSFAVEFSDVLSIDNRTATGAQITAALANSLYGPMLATKGQGRVAIAQRIVRLHAQHDPTERFYPGKGAAKGRNVSGKSLKGNVVFELVQNSELPVTPFSQQTDVRVFFEAYGGAVVAAQLKDQYPAFFRATAAPFNIKFDSEDDDYVSTLCLGRLEQMKQNLMAGVNDPAMLPQMLVPPVSMYEPKHNEKKQWWSDYLDLQSAQEAPQELRQAAEQMYLLHQNYTTQVKIPQAMNEGLVAAAAQAPAAMGAAALQPQPEQQQVEDKSQQIDSDERQQDQEHDHELQLKQKEADSQARLATIQGEYQLKNTELAGKNQIAAVKARPKPVVKRRA